MLVQFFDWGQPVNVSSVVQNIDLGDKVIVHHQWGTLIGVVIDIGQSDKEVEGQIIRKATAQDLEIVLRNKPNEIEVKNIIKNFVRELGLEMKIVEVHLSVDSSCVVAIFTADSRVDFRELVRISSDSLGKSVRFQQVGSRDEAKKIGGFGICGRELCCSKFTRSLKSITTDMARNQMIAHRGSERLSGLCGRLMCCLSYEAEQYEVAGKTMPNKNSLVQWDGQRVKVVDTMVLDQKLKILLPDGKYKIISVEEVEK